MLQLYNTYIQAVVADQLAAALYLVTLCEQCAPWRVPIGMEASSCCHHSRVMNRVDSGQPCFKGRKPRRQTNFTKYENVGWYGSPTVVNNDASAYKSGGLAGRSQLSSETPRRLPGRNPAGQRAQPQQHQHPGSALHQVDGWLPRGSLTPGASWKAREAAQWKKVRSPRPLSPVPATQFSVAPCVTPGAGR
jgi:hypothetical protein